jgi:sulfatase modifying factor 1
MSPRATGAPVAVDTPGDGEYGRRPMRDRSALAFALAAAGFWACAGGPPAADPPRSPPPADAAPMPEKCTDSPQAKPCDSATAASSAPPLAECAPGTHREGEQCVADAPPPPPKPACAAGMAIVPGGTYLYGSARQEVKVPPFCLDLTEVTADSYAACVKSGKCTDTQMKCAAQHTFGVEGKGNHPIVCVDFAQANAYCEAQGKRLPMDEEWEWAARGGTEARQFPWGNDAPKEQLCWSGTSPQTGPCAVGTFPKGDSPQGIHDLAGNVFEWTVSKNDAKSPVRAGRGGSWRDGTKELVRAARAGGFAPSYRCGFLGIRCATKGPE